MHVTFSARGPAGAIAAFCADLGALMAKHGLLDDDGEARTTHFDPSLLPPIEAINSANAPRATDTTGFPPGIMPGAPIDPAPLPAGRKRRERSDKGKPRNGAVAAAPAVEPAPAPIAPAPGRATATWGSPPKVPAAPPADDWGVKPAAPAAPVPTPEPVAGKGSPDDNQMSRFLQAAIGVPGGFQIVAAQLNAAGISSVHSIPAERREGFVRAILSALPEDKRGEVIAFAKGT